MRLIPQVEAESKKVKVQFRDTEEVSKQSRGLKGVIVGRKGSPHYPANSTDAVVYDIRMADGKVHKNIPGRHFTRIN